jgi:glycosyltransferase involved in cell wall biosynthesis
LVSIIIPCFNSGLFVEESIYSCINSEFTNLEIIVVDDGSTDYQTIHLLNNNNWPANVKIIHKQNGGPASARNFGVQHSKGDFLLFLDSDNQILPDYLNKAMTVISRDVDLGVVYSKPEFFGTHQPEVIRFEVKEFNFDALLAGNYIDMCSLVRREAFLEVGGFDENASLIGWEDADLWTRLALTRWRFKFLDETLFKYRVREDSLMGSANRESKVKMLRYFGAKHGFVIHERYRQYFRVMDQIQKKPFSYFLRIIYYKYIKRQSFIK